ncbi:MAG: cation:proton antiporter [Planctomycetota bacterium]
MTPALPLGALPIHPLHPNLLLLLGIAIFGGTVGARVFKRLRIPQVVGYIVIGVLLGDSGIGLFHQDVVESMRPFNYFALGIIGFMIGGELRREVFQKYGKQFFVILMSEGLGAFLFVGGLTTLVAWLVGGDFRSALALGVVLGAISSATAPAATVDVLWEYKSGGPLTTTVLAIVALDDGLALLLFAAAASVSTALLGQGDAGLASSFLKPAYQVIGAAVLGTLAGVMLNYVLRRLKDSANSLAFTIGTVIAVIGLTMMLEVDMILSAMCLGATVANLAPRRSRNAFELVGSFSAPLYVLFFTLVGARLSISNMSLWTGGLALAYVIGRTGGKMLGAWLGALWASAAASVRRYLGLCLFSQAGVAIGLSILAAHNLPADMAQTVLIVITGTTLLVQIIGPPCVKLAIQNAGEVGMNVTEEDLIREHTVGDVMEKNPVTLSEETPLPEVFRTFSAHDFLAYPVVGADQKLVGLISFQELKGTLAYGELQPLLVAHDIADRPVATTTPETPLQEALDQMKEMRLEHIAVLSEPGGKLVGFLDRALVMRAITSELVRRSERAHGHLETA